jgi:hypothetical protein
MASRPTPEEVIQSTREFLERHVQFFADDPDRREFLAAWLENLRFIKEFRNLPLLPGDPDEILTEAVEKIRAAPRSVGHPRRWRDVLIVVAVARLVEVGGFTPTRSVATKEKKPDRKSACSIVAEISRELGVPVEERTVENIWRRGRRS